MSFWPKTDADLAKHSYWLYDGACHACALGEHQHCTNISAVQYGWHGDLAAKLEGISLPSRFRDEDEETTALRKRLIEREQRANPCTCRAAGHTMFAGTCRIATQSGICGRKVKGTITKGSTFGKRGKIEVDVCGLHLSVAQRNQAKQEAHKQKRLAEHEAYEHAEHLCAATDERVAKIKAVLDKLGIVGPAAKIEHDHSRRIGYRSACTGNLIMSSETLAALAEIAEIGLEA